MLARLLDRKMENIPDDLIEINDADVDPDRIMSEIRAGIEARRKELDYEHRNFPKFGVVDCPEEPEDDSGDQELYFYLRAINRANEQQESSDKINSQYSKLKRVYMKLLRVPILGSVITRVRTKFHHMINYYVDRRLREKTGQNKDIVNVLNRLVALNQEQRRQIIELEAKFNSTTPDDKNII